MERIFQMMGDSRVTRWLLTICEVEFNDEQRWHHPIECLERDLKVQQQKLWIQNKSENKRQKQAYEEKKHVGKYNSHFTGNSSMEPKCCFCEESEDHIATNRPKITQIVRYFACQKCVEMAPKERFQELKNKVHHKIKESTVMEYVKEIFYVSTNNTTSIL